ncbi:type IV secretory pathway VirB4 subunit, partial [mine drainage metagenome]
MSKPAKKVDSLREALAPSNVELLPDTLVVGKERVRVLQVERYPATLPYGWLLPFLTAQARVDVVLHLHSVSQDKSRGLLNNEITRLQVELMGKREKGTTDVSSLEHQIGAFEELRAS